MDLYAVLGISRDASRDAIRKAYRRKARTVHPDVGGSPEAFALIRTAHDVLTDGARRKVYDETGKIEEAPVDREMADSLNWISVAIDGILDVCTKRRIDPTEIDMVKDATTFLKAKSDEFKTAIAANKQARKQTEPLAVRFRAKKGKTDRVGAIMRGRLFAIEQNIATNTRQIESISRAMAILADHEYRSDMTDPYQNALASGHFTFSR